MTSIAVQLQPFQRTVEIYESATYYDQQDPQDEEMTDLEDRQTLVENGVDDQDMYSAAEVDSTVVEPPQSDAVRTHAPSTIVDELEYLEVEYEEVEVAPKVPEVHLVHETEAYKADENTAHTPPPESTSVHRLIHSPAARLIPIPRSSTPIASHVPVTEDTDLDDDWPICLYTTTGQEYMLFRSDRDNEALFEDNWLKSQPLETLFSSIRQALEGELSSLTSSFSMDEIVLTVPDLDVSIAEDNCYTREISLQDLVNLINGLCAKNGTQREDRCRLQLSLQPRFIARFNQLVSQTAQAWESSKSRSAAEEHEEEEQHDHIDEDELDLVDEEEPHVEETAEHEGDEDEENHEDEHHEEYEGYEHEDADENEEFDEIISPEVTAPDATISEVVEVAAPIEDSLTAAEEDEIYEENEDSEEYDPNLQSAESLVNEMDDGNEQDHEEEEEEEYQEEYHEGEEEVQEQVNTADVSTETNVTAQPKDSEDSHADEDDLISYEEAVDQTEEGQDYRQQYINEEDSKELEHDTVNGHASEETTTAKPDIAPEMTEVSGDVQIVTDETTSPGSPNSKRHFGETIETPAEDQAPPPKRAKS